MCLSDPNEVIIEIEITSYRRVISGRETLLRVRVMVTGGGGEVHFSVRGKGGGVATVARRWLAFR